MNGRIIDFHSHILPGVDDGSDSPETSLAMLRMEAEQGIRHVVATPHFYPRHDDLRTFLKKRKKAERLLREAMEHESGLPELSIGAEVHYFPGICESEFLRELTIGGTSCVLVEMPMTRWTEAMYRDLEGMAVKRGITPIVAHMDRYIRPLRTYGIPEKLFYMPVLVQANAGFFLDRTTARMALRLLREDKIQLLGSDCHNLTTRPPNLAQAVERIRTHLDPRILDRICAYQEDVLYAE